MKMTVDARFRDYVKRTLLYFRDESEENELPFPCTLSHDQRREVFFFLFFHPYFFNSLIMNVIFLFYILCERTVKTELNLHTYRCVFGSGFTL